MAETIPALLFWLALAIFVLAALLGGLAGGLGQHNADRCPLCNGRGAREAPVQRNGYFTHDTIICEHCHGTGQRPEEEAET